MWFTIKYLPGLYRALGSIPSTTGAVIHICNLSTLYLQMEHRQKNHLEACRPVSMEYLLILAESVGEILSQKQGGREQLLTAVLLPPHMFYGRFTCPHILRQQRGRGLWKVHQWKCCEIVGISVFTTAVIEHQDQSSVWTQGFRQSMRVEQRQQVALARTVARTHLDPQAEAVSTQGVAGVLLKAQNPPQTHILPEVKLPNPSQIVPSIGDQVFKHEPLGGALIQTMVNSCLKIQNCKHKKE